MFCIAIQDEYHLVQEIYGPYEDTNQCMAQLDRMNRDRKIPEGWRFKIFSMLK